MPKLKVCGIGSSNEEAGDEGCSGLEARESDSAEELRGVKGGC